MRRGPIANPCGTPDIGLFDIVTGSELEDFPLPWRIQPSVPTVSSSGNNAPVADILLVKPHFCAERGSTGRDGPTGCFQYAYPVAYCS